MSFHLRVIPVSLWHVMNRIKTKYVSCLAHLTEMTKCSSRLLTKQRTDDAAVTQKHLTEGCFKFLIPSASVSFYLKPPILSPCFCSLPPMPASHVGGTKKWKEGLESKWIFVPNSYWNSLEDFRRYHENETYDLKTWRLQPLLAPHRL